MAADLLNHSLNTCFLIVKLRRLYDHWIMTYVVIYVTCVTPIYPIVLNAPHLMRGICACEALEMSASCSFIACGCSVTIFLNPFSLVRCVNSRAPPFKKPVWTGNLRSSSVMGPPDLTTISGDKATLNISDKTKRCIQLFSLTALRSISLNSVCFLYQLQV